MQEGGESIFVSKWEGRDVHSGALDCADEYVCSWLRDVPPIDCSPEYWGQKEMEGFLDFEDSAEEDISYE